MKATTKPEDNRYIYWNGTSKRWRIIFTSCENNKTKVHYFGSYESIEKARETRDQLLKDGSNPFSKAPHNKNDDDVAKMYLEKYNKMFDKE